MFSRNATPLALLAGLAVTLSLVPATANAAAPAEEELVTVTPGSNLLDVSQTRATGHIDFTKFGLHVWTEGATSTDKAAGYIAVDYPLSEVGEPSLEWLYNEPLHLMKPGLQIMIDKEADGDYDGILVGEPWAYGDDWWSGSAGLTDSGLNCPSGCGSTNSGTLDEWRTAYPSAHVLAVGFSLGSGAHGNGTLTAMTYGDTRYEFSNVEPVVTPVVDLVGKAKVVGSRCDRSRIQLRVGKLPADTSASKPKVVFKLKDRKRLKATTALSAGSSAVMRQSLGDRKVHVYRVFADGQLILTSKVRNSC